MTGESRNGADSTIVSRALQEHRMNTSLESSGTLAAVLKRSAVGVALVVGLAGGSAAGLLDRAGAQETTAPSASTQQSPLNSVADVAAKVNPAVVTITNLQTQVDPFSGHATGDGKAMPVGAGSGFIIDAAGHVVTNYHVVQGGESFEVRFYDGTTVSATLVGGDQLQDVAVLQLELAAGQSVPDTVALGDSNGVRAGDQVIAIGSPYGELTNSVTTGTVNAVNRELDTGEGYALPNLLQHDASIYPGNSGGPLVNLSGEVVGINVAKASQLTGMDSSDSIGFAIEIDAVTQIVNEIIADGQFDRPYLGVQAQPVISRDQQSIDGQGIITVEPGSPADKAGLQAGDIITAVDGVTLDQDHQFINLVIFDHQPGDTVTLTVDRDGQTQQIQVTLGTRPAELGA
jgi:S1-C subfamily serine protease